MFAEQLMGFGEKFRDVLTPSETTALYATIVRRNNRLSYRRGTVRRAMLANSCYV